MQDIEALWLSGDDDKLYRMLKPTVQGCAIRYAARWRGIPVPRDDFESAFWEVTWKMAEKPYAPSDYYFYDTLLLAFRRRALDVVDAAIPRMRKQRDSDETEEDLAVFIENWDDERWDKRKDETVHVEDSVTDKLLVEQILCDPVLNEKDIQLLYAMYQNPGASLRELQKITGENYPTKVKDRLERIIRKLKHYEDE